MRMSLPPSASASSASTAWTSSSTFATAPCPLASSCSPVTVVFFFQAEDGIREYKVTGVQTCALPISAAAYKRAVQLGTDLEAQPRRLAAAAEASAEIGDLDHARGLATRAAAQTTDPVVQARLANVRARADVAQGQLHAAHQLLVEGAAQIASLDALQATRMLTYAMHVAWYAGDRGLVADTADRLKAVGGSLAEPLTPFIQLMLRLARQAAERPGDDLPSLADLVAQARRSRAGDPYDL